MLDIKVMTLLSVARTLNFTRTGEELGLTQPAVSNHIKKLEEDLGVSLFLKKKGKLVLSPEGQIVVTYAKRMSALCDKMQLRLKEQRNGISRIRVGVTHTQESNPIIEALSSLSLENNNVSITIITDTIKNLYEMLGNFEIDIAIIEGRPTGSDINYIMLDTDSLVCVLAPDHPLSGKSMITLSELKKQHLILRLPTSSTRMKFESALEAINDSIENFDVSVEVDNIATIKDLVRKKFGVSILPKKTCMSEIRKKKLTALPIENLSMLRETNIVYHKTFSHTNIIDAIAAYYERTVAGMKDTDKSDMR